MATLYCVRRRVPSPTDASKWGQAVFPGYDLPPEN
jgi:hypothetical protein